MKPWLILTYKMPREPSAPRVAIWRKLRRLAALPLHDAAWTLPDTPRTREQLLWLAADIQQAGGEATLWTASPLHPPDNPTLEQQFLDPVETEYHAILQALNSTNPDLPDLARRFQHALERDHLASPLARKVRAALLAASGDTPP